MSQLQDRHNRVINYLRVSLTDACNLRCRYCMPELMRFSPKPDLMQGDEVMRLIRIFAQLGVEKVRFTGGEPTLRDDLVHLIRETRALETVKTVALTTNGLRLSRLLPQLVDAGLQRVNISLDTLDPDRFRELTRRDRLADVLQGLHDSLAAGLEVKVNCVVMRGVNDDTDLIGLSKLAMTHGIQLRFIEMMPFAGTVDVQEKSIVRSKEIRDRIERVFGPLVPANGGKLDGEAMVYQFSEGHGQVGFISPVSTPFCSECNRVRLTQDGRLRLCLLHEDEGDLLTHLRHGESDEVLLMRIRKVVWRKPVGHELAAKKIPENRTMSQIGG